MRALLSWGIAGLASALVCGCAHAPPPAAPGQADLHRLLAPYAGQWESEDPLQSMDVVRYRLSLGLADGGQERRGDLSLFRETAGSGMRQMSRFTRLPRVRYTAALKCTPTLRGARTTLIPMSSAGGYSCLMQLARTDCSSKDCFVTCPNITLEGGHLSSSNGDAACHYRRLFNDRS